VRSNKHAQARHVAAAIAVVVVVAAGVGGCSPPAVTITLKPAENLVAPPEFVRFAFPVKDADVEEAGPFGLQNIPDEAFAAVPPGVSFSVDVIGCLSNDRAECEDPGSFVARGCDGPFSRQRDTELAIEIVLLPAVEGNAVCPVAP
jgi:hypothetical protein